MRLPQLAYDSSSEKDRMPPIRACAQSGLPMPGKQAVPCSTDVRMHGVPQVACAERGVFTSFCHILTLRFKLDFLTCFPW